MARKRKCDAPVNPTRYRTERFLQDGGKWFFATREGTLEGPFESQLEAEERLDVYLGLLGLDLLPDAEQFKAG